LNAQRLPKLTTTSFALLGLLQRRPWSAYELTQYMRSSILRAVWPRAESHLYSEPKLLQKRGLVESREEHTGARKRTVYSITDSGRDTLATWLREERESEYRFEYELLLRFAFAETVDASQLNDYLQQVRAEAVRDARVALEGIEELLKSPGELSASEHAAYTGAIINMIADQLETRINWADAMLERFALERSGDLSLALYQQGRERLISLLEAAGD
jgi:DNA-binding PadR family transcriptional regulator